MQERPFSPSQPSTGERWWTMQNITHENQENQEVIHFFHRDYFTLDSFVKSPGQPFIPFSQASSFDDKACFLFLSSRPGFDFPPDAVLIPTDNVPKGSHRVFVLPPFFKLLPMARNLPKRAFIVRNPDLYPGPDGTGDIALVIITHRFHPRDPQLEPLPSPEEKRPHLHVVKSKKQPVPREVRYDRPPKDILKYFSYLNDKHQFTKVLKVMYKESEYRHLGRLKHWRGKKDMKARVYLAGFENLVKKTGLSPRTLNRARSLMIESHIIRHRGAGIKGTGYAIHELPLNMPHVHAWVRNPPR